MVFYENILSEMIQADILECLTPNSTASMPLRIFNSSLHASVSVMKRRWKHKRQRLENIIYMQQQQHLHQQLQLQQQQQQQRSLSSSSSSSSSSSASTGRGHLHHPHVPSNHTHRFTHHHPPVQPPVQLSVPGEVVTKPRMGFTSSHNSSHSSSSHSSSTHTTHPTLHSDAQQLFNTISAVVFSGSSGQQYTLFIYLSYCPPLNFHFYIGHSC